MAVLHVLSLTVLLVVPAYLLAKSFVVNAMARSLAFAMLLILPHTAITLSLHYMGIPIQQSTLRSGQCLYLLLAVVASICKASRKSPSPRKHDVTAWLYWLGAALLIFPYTRFAGIDTYKWQDLATAIRVDAAIPWLIHPAGLFGFLPRSYPTIHPILLATLQIGGDLGVDAGFRFISLIVLTVGFISSRCWFATFSPAKYANLGALLYVLSPVFVRYTHWATGRGLFMALFPALLYALHTKNSSAPNPPNCGQRLIKCSLIGILYFLLLLSHKAAWFVLPLLFVAYATHRLIPRAPVARGGVLIPFCLVALLISPSILLPGFAGNALGAIWLMLSRFIWLFPIAIASWIDTTSAVFQKAPYTKSVLLLCIPLALDPQMYGALIATPFLVAAAVSYMPIALSRTSDQIKGLTHGLALGLSLATALAIVLVRSSTAATADVKAAAMFLNQHNPRGPFMIHAPSPERTRLQAYANGCPRFVLTGTPQIVARLPAPPNHGWKPSRSSILAWTAWFRNLLQIEGLHVQWYGEIQHHYHFQIGDRGDIPQSAQLLYKNDTVRIYEKPSHTTPRL